MSALHPTVRVPGADGLLVFVMLDMLFFGLMLTAFAVGRIGHVDDYEAARRALDVGLGMANTMVLLASSWAVAVAVRAGFLGQPRVRALGLALAIALGLVFVVIKQHEYRTKLAAGLTPLTNDFFTWYYAVTGLHLLHVLGGLVALALVARLPVQPASARATESVGLFWHMVDLLWLMLFPILYLV